MKATGTTLSRDKTSFEHFPITSFERPKNALRPQLFHPSRPDVLAQIDRG